ncbi:hypothetical protein [Prauserella muralis]
MLLTLMSTNNYNRGVDVVPIGAAAFIAWRLIHNQLRRRTSRGH